MRYIIICFIFGLCHLSMMAQTEECNNFSDDSLSMAQILKIDANASYPLKFNTIETVIQQNDGVEMFKTIRYVEYTIKDNKNAYTIKRKVVKTQKNAPKDAANSTSSFPDITSKLLSGILKPGEVRKYLPSKWILCKKAVKEGKKLMIIDKLALAGGNAEEHVMGTVMIFQTIRETLSYNTDTDLDLKNLDSIISEIALNDISKKADVHQVKVVETIKIKL